MERWVIVFEDPKSKYNHPDIVVLKGKRSEVEDFARKYTRAYGVILKEIISLEEYMKRKRGEGNG